VLAGREKAASRERKSMEKTEHLVIEFGLGNERKVFASKIDF
jgi:hypothetical protein